MRREQELVQKMTVEKQLSWWQLSGAMMGLGLPSPARKELVQACTSSLVMQKDQSKERKLAYSNGALCSEDRDV